VNLLAIDTSSNACSVALQIADECYEQFVVEPRAHTKILLPMISTLFEEAEIQINELDTIVLGNGPGSFIGMRIGASVAQGMCFGAGIGVIPLSSLAAIAAEVFAEHGAERVAVAQDARMNEVYFAEFRKDAAGLPELLGDEAIVPVGRLPISGDDVALAGAAWTKYPQLLQDNLENSSSLLPVTEPRAKHLLGLGAVCAENDGIIAPEHLQPAYLRNVVAQAPVARSKHEK